MKFQLDGKETYSVSLNNTNPANGSALIFSSDNMEDGDHQLRGSIESREQNGGIILDYFECVASFIPSVPSIVPTVSPNPGLRIHLEAALIFFGRGQMRQMYPKRQPLSLVPVATRVLY
jgi:hypothetical protein